MAHGIYYASIVQFANVVIIPAIKTSLQSTSYVMTWQETVLNMSVQNSTTHAIKFY